MLSTKTRLTCLFIALSIFLFLPNIVFCQAGALDPSFGTGGFAPTSFGLTKLRIGNDGKIIALGLTNVNGVSTPIVSRYTPSGNIDPSFGGGNGFVLISFFNPFSIALQSDGKIVVVGTTQQDFAVMRFNSDGTIDNSFGQNGMVQTNIFIHTLTDGNQIFSQDEAHSVEIQSDSKIVVAGTMFEGYTQLNHFAIVRYNTDGSLDFSFAQQGILVTGLLGFGEQQKDLGIKSDGTIILLGTGVEPFIIAAMASYTPNGSFISKYLTKSAGSSQSYGFALGVNGLNTELLGYSSYIFTTTNKPDNYFIDGFTGMIQLDPKYYRESLKSIAIQQDGKVLVGGNFNGQLVLLRFNSDGTPDAGFGTNGEALYTFNVGTSLTITPTKAFNSGAGIVSVLLQGPTSLQCHSDTTVFMDAEVCTAVVRGIDPQFLPVGTSAAINYTLSGATVGSGVGSASGLAFNKGQK